MTNVECVTVVDTAELIETGCAFSIDGEGARTQIGASYLEDFDTVWFRRAPAPNALPEEPESSRRFARANWDEFLLGIKILREQRWVNRPIAHYLASNKILQLSVAQELGFPFPRTLITNRPSEAAEFSLAEPSICKALCNVPEIPTVITTAMTAEHVDDIDLLRTCPAIFQRLVPSEVDVRVIAIGSRLFAGELVTRNGADPLDWRCDPNNPWHPHNLDHAVGEFCLAMMVELGLEYGAFDFRITPDGEYVFFEVNPGGQFLFLEAWTKQSISCAIAEYLVQPVGTIPPSQAATLA